MVRDARHKRTNITYFFFYEVPKANSETRSRVYQGLGKRRKRRDSLMGIVSVWSDENKLEIENGNGCTTL